MITVAIVGIALVLGWVAWWSSGPRFQRRPAPVSRPDVMNDAVQQRLHSDSTHGWMGSA